VYRGGRPQPPSRGSPCREFQMGGCGSAAARTTGVDVSNYSGTFPAEGPGARPGCQDHGSWTLLEALRLWTRLEWRPSGFPARFEPRDGGVGRPPAATSTCHFSCRSTWHRSYSTTTVRGRRGRRTVGPDDLGILICAVTAETKAKALEAAVTSCGAWARRCASRGVLLAGGNALAGGAPASPCGRGRARSPRMSYE